MNVIKISVEKSIPVVEKYTIEGTLESLKEQVGGWIESVDSIIPNVTLICDEDGKSKQRPINFLATLLTPLFGMDWVVGDVLVVSTDGDRLDDIPFHVEEALLTLWGAK